MSQKIISILNRLTFFSLAAILFFVPLYFNAFGETKSIFELGKDSFFKIVLSLGWILFLIKQILNDKYFDFKKYKSIFYFIILLVFSFSISVLLALHPLESFWGNYHRFQGFTTLIFYLLFFLLLIFQIKNFEVLKKFILVSLVGSFFVCLYGLLQYVDIDFKKWTQPAYLTQRIFSSVGQPNFLGHYLIMIIPFNLFFLFYFWKKKKEKLFIIFSFLLFFQLACLILTYSRAAWLGFGGFLSAFIFLFLFFNNQKRKAFIFLSIILLTSLFLIFISLKSFYQPYEARKLNFFSRVQSIVDLKNSSNRMRLHDWNVGIEILKKSDFKRILFGYGPDDLHDLFASRYQSGVMAFERIDTISDRSHNLFLDNLLQFGIIGFSSLILFIGYIIFKALIFLKIKNKDAEFWLVLILLADLFGYFINNLLSFSAIATSLYLYFILAILFTVCIYDNN